jgi:hypothetical protein
MTLLPLGATLSLLLAAANPYLAEAKVFYDEFEFEKCLKRLDKAATPDSTRAELAQIELYGGLCEFNLGREDAARRRFRMALRFDPAVGLPPETSPKIEELFRAEARRPSEELPPSLVPRPAETTNANPALSVGPAQPGVGRHVGPVVLAGAAVAFCAVGVWAGLEAKGAERLANTEEFDQPSFDAEQRARSRATLANVAFAGAATTAAVAAIWFLLSRP